MIARYRREGAPKGGPQIVPVRNPDLALSAALDESHDGRLTRAAVLVTALSVFGGVVWAAATPVDEVTTGQGVVRTESLPERIEHPDGGVVADLRTEIGALLEPGETILVLDLAALETERVAVRAQLRRLAEERAWVDHILKADPEHLGEIAAPPPDGADDPAFWAEQAYLAAQLDLLAANRATLEERLSVTDGVTQTMADEIALIDGQIARYEDLAQSAAIRRLDREAILRERILLERSALEMAGERARLVSELDANALERQELLTQRRRDAAVRRAELDERIVTLSQSQAELDSRIARGVVQTTRGGRVQELAVSAPKEVIAPGELIAEVIPEGSDLVAAVEVPADRIGAIDPGMAARLKITTYDFTRFGVIDGVVSSISPSSVVNEAGETVYRVVVDLPDGGAAPQVAGRAVRPGMTVVADIRSGRKTVLAYLLKPLRTLKDRALVES